MKLNSLYILLLLPVVVLFSFDISTSIPQNGSIKVEGQVLYNYGDPLYQGLNVQGRIFEKGKLVKTFKCDDKGRFNTTVNVNHDYRFKFSMDYHGTTIVSINTQLPPEKSTGDVGGIFRFKCEIFERVQGLNMYILKKPLIKIRYVAEKDEFEPDKAWTEAFLRELENFKETLATYKERGRKVLKDPPKPKAVAQKSTTKAPTPKTTEPEIEKKKKVNTSGHRNIMDNLKEDEEEEEEIAEVTEDTTYKEDLSQLEEPEEFEEEIEEEEPEEFILPPSRMPTISVQPRRQKISLAATISDVDKNEMKEQAYEKVKEKDRQIAEKRLSNSVLLAAEKERQLYNKQIQSLRLRGIITTVAAEEKKSKIYNYRKNPVLEFEVLPEVRRSEIDGFFVDTEHLLLVFPTKKIRYKKETYFFGFNYYYKNGEEITEDQYCKDLLLLTKQPELCEN